MRILSSARTCITNTWCNTMDHLFCSPYSALIFLPKPSTVWYIQIPTFHLLCFTVIIQCILGESVFSWDHEKHWKQKRTITRFRLYTKSFSKLNTNTTYLANMQCFSFTERIAKSFCNHQSTKTKKPQKGLRTRVKTQCHCQESSYASWCQNVRQKKATSI